MPDASTTTTILVLGKTCKICRSQKMTTELNRSDGSAVWGHYWYCNCGHVEDIQDGELDNVDYVNGKSQSPIPPNTAEHNKGGIPDRNCPLCDTDPVAAGYYIHGDGSFDCEVCQE